MLNDDFFAGQTQLLSEELNVHSMIVNKRWYNTKPTVLHLNWIHRKFSGLQVLPYAACNIDIFAVMLQVFKKLVPHWRKGSVAEFGEIE